MPTNRLALGSFSKYSELRFVVFLKMLHVFVWILNSNKFIAQHMVVLCRLFIYDSYYPFIVWVHRITNAYNKQYKWESAFIDATYTNLKWCEMKNLTWQYICFQIDGHISSKLLSKNNVLHIRLSKIFAIYSNTFWSINILVV